MRLGAAAAFRFRLAVSWRSTMLGLRFAGDAAGASLGAPGAASPGGADVAVVASAAASVWAVASSIVCDPAAAPFEEVADCPSR